MNYPHHYYYHYHHYHYHQLSSSSLLSLSLSSLLLSLSLLSLYHHHNSKTRLSKRGIDDARILNKRILQKDSNVGDFSRIDLLICSPLTRALQTAEIGLNGDIIRKDIPRIVHPLARERLYLSSDVGRPKTELQQDYPNWNYDYLEENNWWYCHPKNEKYIEWRPQGIYAIEGEIEPYFIDRMKKLKKFLIDREEKCIAVVCHWGVARALTKRSLENCEVLSISSDELLEEPYVDKS